MSALAPIGSAQGADLSTGCEIVSDAEPAPAPAGGTLTVTYFGVSTLMFSDGKDRLLIDGFFSRPAPLKTLLLPIGPKPKTIREGLGDGLPPVRAILTAHGHHDHVLDTAAVAGLEPAAIVVGTPSVIKLMRQRGVSGQRLCIPREDHPMVFGPYTIRAFHVPHGPSPFYLRWLLDAPLKRAPKGAAPFWRYKDDQNLSYLIEYGGRRILVNPSAGLPKRGFDAETVFLGIGRLGAMSRTEAELYWASAVGEKATTVVPIHWDRFTTPLGDPLISNPKVLDDFAEARRRVCDFAGRRPTLTVLKIDSKGVLELPPGRPAEGRSSVTRFCD